MNNIQSCHFMQIVTANQPINLSAEELTASYNEFRGILHSEVDNNNDFRSAYRTLAELLNELECQAVLHKR